VTPLAPEVLIAHQRRVDARLAEFAEVARRAANHEELPTLVDRGVPRAILEDGPDERLLAPELVAWAREFPAALDLGGGGILTGPTGSGKTWSVSWVLRELYRCGELRGVETSSPWWWWPDSRYTHFDDLVAAAETRGGC